MCEGQIGPTAGLVYLTVQYFVTSHLLKFLVLYNCMSVPKHMVYCWPFTTEAEVWSQASPCGICQGQSGTGIDFCSNNSAFPSVITLSLHHKCNTVTYHQCYINMAVGSTFKSMSSLSLK